MIRIPGYTLQKKLGAGGMATVYLAVQESLQREVALKVMSPALAADRTFARRFVGEARTIAELNHPNIVSIHDVGVTEDHLHYFAMQYLPGGDLDDKIAERLPEKDLLRILLAMCGALAHAHERGFVHRDVTPGNIMFDSSDQPVLTDFGIATVVSEATRMTATGLSLGTSYYMSPEQARGRSVDARSDVYSLGGVIFEALCGQPPYEGDDSFAVAYAHVYEPVPKLPPRFLRWQEVIERCMAKSPDDRYASMHELAAVLQGFLERTSGQGRRAESTGPSSDATVVLAVPTQVGGSPSTSGRYRWIWLAMGERPSEWISGLRPAVSRGAAWLRGRLARRPALRWLDAPAGVLLAAAIGWWFFGPEDAAPTELVASTPAPVEPAQRAQRRPAPRLQPAPEPEPLTTVPSVSPGPPALVDLENQGRQDSAQVESMTPQSRQRLFTLLAEAAAALDDDRLTTPPDDNAFDLFQSALSLDSDNAQALSGLRRIVSRYVVLARTQIERGRYQRALALEERARRVARQIDLDTATGKELDAVSDFGYERAMARGREAVDRGNRDAARVHFQAAAIFRETDPEVAEALRRLELPPEASGPQKLVDKLASGGEGPTLVVLEDLGIAVGESEVTVADYERFVTATDHPWQEQPCRNLESWLRASRNRNWQAPGFQQTATHPVVCVSWQDAALYVRWLSRETGQRYRLPQVAEWQQFAGPLPGPCEENWADQALAEQMRRTAQDCNDGFAFTAPTGQLSLPSSGLQDVYGNVREWTADCVRRRNDRCRQYAVAGQSWMDGDRSRFGQSVEGYDGEQRFNTIGLRVVREL